MSLITTHLLSIETCIDRYTSEKRSPASRDREPIPSPTNPEESPNAPAAVAPPATRDTQRGERHGQGRQGNGGTTRSVTPRLSATRRRPFHPLRTISRPSAWATTSCTARTSCASTNEASVLKLGQRHDRPRPTTSVATHEGPAFLVRGTKVCALEGGARQDGAEGVTGRARPSPRVGRGRCMPDLRPRRASPPPAAYCPSRARDRGEACLRRRPRFRAITRFLRAIRHAPFVAIAPSSANLAAASRRAVERKCCRPAGRGAATRWPLGPH